MDYRFEIDCIEDNDTDWCEGCSGRGHYCRVGHTANGKLTAPRFTAWLCRACRRSGNRIMMAYQLKSEAQLRRSERSAEDEPWARALGY